MHALLRSRKHYLTTAIAAATTLLVGCGQAPTQFGADHVPDSNIALSAAKDGKFNTLAWPMVDSLMVNWLDGATAPGCAVGVTIDDQVTYLKGYGRARLGISGHDWNVATMGSIGSVSKTFTALGAMRQVERGWADFEDQVDHRLPIGGELGNAILFKLLSHTAGAGGASASAAFQPNWDNGSPFHQCRNATTPDAADPLCTEVHRAALDPTDLAQDYASNEANNVEENLAVVDADGNGQGDGWQAIYSNVGYSVAGAMVGAVAKDHGYSGYEDFIWDHVGTWSDNPLAPGQATSLAITHRHRATDIPGRAVGYYDGNLGVGPKNWVQSEAWESTPAQASWFGPSGGWAITIGDFARLLAAYQSNRIVNASSRSWMELEIGHLALGPDAFNLPPYGLGLIVDDANGSVYHGGDIGPYVGGANRSAHSAVWSLWPNAVGSADIGVALICNNGRPSGSLYSQAKNIVEALQAAPTSRPVSTQTHATLPSPSAVDRRTYRTDTSAGYVLLPDGFPMLPALLDPLMMEPNLSQRTLQLRHLSGSQPGATAGLLNATRLERGRLVAGSGPLQLRAGPLAMSVNARSLSFQVANDGSRFYDGRAEALVDARNLVQTGMARNTSQVCEAVRAARSSCTPCADGVAVCFTAAVGGIQATRIN